ncbi:MAG: hypothetical protein GEV07_06405 [Streptosporangiales bacterium]|nr:hypothetical protein [Streptosporangiales bacterium]
MSDNWVFDGGRPAVDLLNTLRDRPRGGRELLVTTGDLADWLLAAGLVVRRPRPTAGQLAGFLAVREACDVVLLSPAPTRRAVRVLNDAAAAVALPVPRLRLTADGTVERSLARLADPVGAALAVVAVDAIELATGDAAVRECAADDCGLRFVDLSQRRSRQWCSMTRCGNRAKARAHYARTRPR